MEATKQRRKERENARKRLAEMKNNAAMVLYHCNYSQLTTQQQAKADKLALTY